MRPTALIPALVLMALVWAIDLPATLGAHPWWSGKAVWIGTPVGLALAWLISLQLGPGGRLVVLGVALILAGASAYFGKQVFVNSFGDNALAGRFWFFGWIASMGALAALLATLSDLWLAHKHDDD